MSSAEANLGADLADLKRDADQHRKNVEESARTMFVEAVDRVGREAQEFLRTQEYSEAELQRHMRLITKLLAAMRGDNSHGDILDHEISNGDDPIASAHLQEEAELMKAVARGEMPMQISADEAFADEPVFEEMRDELPEETVVSIQFAGESAVTFGLPADTKPEDVAQQTQGALSALLALRQKEVE